MLREPIGILSVVCIVVPSMFTAATPVGAISNNLGLSTETLPYDKVLVKDWYKTFIKNDFPHLTFPVKIYTKVLNFEETILTYF